MIDIHCHILPGLDDGAVNIKTSLQMAKLAVREGFTDIIATPHHLKGKFCNNGETVRAACQALNKELIAAQIPLTIHPGQEVRIHDELLAGLGQGTVIPLAASNAVLIELPTKSVPLYTAYLISQLLVAGYQPIIAHPERNEVLRKNPDHYKNLIAAGAKMQLTAGSLTGAFGRKTKKFSVALVKDRAIDFIATDAHDTVKRPLVIQKSIEQLDKITGDPSWTETVLANSRKLIMQ